MALLGGSPRMATAKELEECSLLAMSRREPIAYLVFSAHGLKSFRPSRNRQPRRALSHQVLIRRG